MNRPYIYIAVKIEHLGYKLGYPVFSLNQPFSTRRYNPMLWVNTGQQTVNMQTVISVAMALTVNLTMLGNDNSVKDRLAKFLVIAYLLRKITLRNEKVRTIRK